MYFTGAKILVRQAEAAVCGVPATGREYRKTVLTRFLVVDLGLGVCRVLLTVVHSFGTKNV